MLPPLVAFLVADIGQFKLKMAEAATVAEATTVGTSSKFQRLAAAGKVAMIAAAASIALVTGAAFELEKRAEEAGQAAFEMSEKFGLTGKQASTWVQVGALIGVSTGQMSNAFRFLTRNMENTNLAMKAHPGHITPIMQAYKTLGISIFDATGHLRSADDVMRDAVIAFGRMPPGVEKAGLAMKLFGRSGQNLLPLLNQGKVGLDQLTAAAIKSGAVMENDQVKAAHAAFLAHKQLDVAITGLTNQLAIGLLPVGVQVFGWMTNTAVPAIKNAIGWTKQHTDVVKIVAAAIAGPLLLAIGAYIVSMGAAAVATIAATWPILLIIGALALVGVAIYLLITHWKQISETVKRVAADLWRYAVGAWNTIAVAVGTILLGMVRQIQSAAQEFHDRPIYWILRLALWIPLKLRDIILAVAQWHLEMGQKASAAGAAMWRAVLTWLSKLPALAQTWLLATLQQVIQTGVDVVKAFFGLGQRMHDALFSTDWLKVGYNIIEGIKSGIVAAVMGLLGVIHSVADQVLNAFKDAFGIHSPSLLIATKVGMPIGQGVGVGILGQATSAAAAMRSLVRGAIGAGSGQAVTVGASLAGSLGAGIQAGSAQGQIGASNHWQVNFNGPVATKYTADQVIRRLEDQAHRRGLLNAAGTG